MTDEHLSQREKARRKMVAFYARWFPEKLDHVDRILDKYPGQEEDVVRTFRTKYPEWNWDLVPQDMSAAAQRAKNSSPQPPHSQGRPPPPHRPETQSYRPDTQSYYQLPSQGTLPASPASKQPIAVIPQVGGKDHNLNITLTLQTAPHDAPYHGGFYDPLGHERASPSRYAPPPPPPPQQQPPLPPPPPSHPANTSEALWGDDYGRGYGPYGSPVGPQTPVHHPPVVHNTTPSQPHISPRPGGDVMDLSQQHPSRANTLSRPEIEGALVALEAKLTEAQRQDAKVLEAKLDQLLQQMQHRLQDGHHHQPPPPVHQQHVSSSPIPTQPSPSMHRSEPHHKPQPNQLEQQLRDLISKVDQLSMTQRYDADRPAATTPQPPPSRPTSQLEELQEKVRNLEATLASHHHPAPPPSNDHSLSRAENPQVSGTWNQGRDSGLADFVDLLKQENSKKAAEIDNLAQSTVALQQQLGDQQQRYMRDLAELQRKLNSLEGQTAAVNETRDLAQRLHGAIQMAAQAQAQNQAQQRQLLEAAHAAQASAAQAAALAQSAHQSVHAKGEPEPPSGTGQSAELRRLQEEIEELRRRDDLSRKIPPFHFPHHPHKQQLIHEKQMLLDTMFALSHQTNSPKGTPKPSPNATAYPPAQPIGHQQQQQQLQPAPPLATYQPSYEPRKTEVHHHHYPQAPWTAGQDAQQSVHPDLGMDGASAEHRNISPYPYSRTT